MGKMRTADSTLRSSPEYRSGGTEVEIDVLLPSLLRESAGGEAILTARGSTLREALQDLLARNPLLKIHLFDEQEHLRKHVLLYFNGQSLDQLESLDVRLRPGDELQVVQAVSGG